MLIDPALDAILAYCAGDPIERVFLEDVARRGLARFRAVEGEEGLDALCYFGANVVPSGVGCEAFGGEAAVRGTRMIIGEEAAAAQRSLTAASSPMIIRVPRTAASPPKASHPAPEGTTFAPK